MAYPSVTHSFTNGTTASATQVNQNFTDLINGFSDATKDFSMNAGTLAGAFTANGHCTLGNAAADDLTINASLASSLAIKTNNTYNIGGATLALAGLYLGAPSSRSTRLTAHQSLGATNTLVLPNGNGNAYQSLITDGSGNLSWSWATGIYATKNDNYQVLDTDGYGCIYVTVVNKTITLPTAADNTNRIITIVKEVSGNGTITIKGEAAGETVDDISGSTGITLDIYKEAVTLVCTGAVWKVLSWTIPVNQTTLTVTGTNWTTARAIGYITKSRVGDWSIDFRVNGAVTSGARTNYSVTVANVTFKNTSQNHSISCFPNFSSAAISVVSWAGANSNTLNIYHDNDTINAYAFQGNVELESKPSIVL